VIENLKDNFNGFGCKQLGGACDIEFIGETFNEIINNL